MKIAARETTLNTGTEMVEEDFDIGNKPMILKILRSLMYSNPIRTICQEVMSNARDAHREHGNPERPIQVKLPNKMDPEFWIRDYGVGISPERMSNVFIRYGNSTKRDSNQQTGGFGLGAKSPWAYADSFQVETYLPDEKGQMWRRRYAAVIDKSDQGKLLQVDQPEKTTEERGTKVSVQVKEEDGAKFAHWVEDRARFWDPRPEVIGDSNFNWITVTPLFQGDGWMITAGGNSTGIALLDGIPYPVERSSVLQPDEMDGEAPCKLAFDMGFVIDLKVGEVSVAATREGIDYNDDTIPVLRRHLEEMMTDVARKVSEAIENAADLWEANRIFKSLPALPKAAVRGTAQWNGHPVNGDFSMPGGFKTVLFERDHKRYGQGVGTKSSQSNYFTFPSKDERVFVLDEENLQRGRALYLFRTNDRDVIEKVRVIVVPTGDTPERKKEIAEAYDKAEKEHGLRTAIESLDGFSTIEKWNYRKHGPKVSKANGGPRFYGGPVIRVKEMNGSKWKESSVTFDEDEVVFVQLYGGKPHKAPGRGGYTTLDHCREMQVQLGVKVVGVQTPFITKVPESWIWLSDAIEERYQEVIANPDYAAAMTLGNADRRFKTELGDFDRWIDAGKVVIGENGLIDQWRVESERQDELGILQLEILGWSAYAGHAAVDVVIPGPRLKAMQTAALQAMPFLKIIERTVSGSQTSLMEEVQWYLDEKDPARELDTDLQVKSAADADAETKQFKADRLDKKAHDLYKGNGGSMTYTQIEEHLDMKRHNGNAGRRAVLRHQKRMGQAVA